MRRALVITSLIGVLALSPALVSAQNFAFTAGFVSGKLVAFTGTGRVRQLGKVNFPVPAGEFPNNTMIAAVYAFGAIDGNGETIRNALRTCRMKLTGSANGSTRCQTVSENVEGVQVDGLVAIIEAARIGSGTFGIQVKPKGGSRLRSGELAVHVAGVVDLTTLSLRPGAEGAPALTAYATTLLAEQIRLARERTAR